MTLGCSGLKDALIRGNASEPPAGETSQQAADLRPVALLDPRAAEPIDLRFFNPLEVHTIYSAFGQAFGIDVRFDPEVRNPKIGIELIDVKVQTCLDILTQLCHHLYKVLDENTILIVDDTPGNRRRHGEQVTRTFQVENLSVQDAASTLRSLLGVRDLEVAEQSRQLTLRDSLVKVQIAEEILRIADRPKAEVLVGVELVLVDAGPPRDPASSDSVPARLSVDELQRLKDQGEIRALDVRQELSLSEGEEETVVLDAGVPSLEVRVRPKAHPERDEVTLNLRLRVGAAVENGGESPAGRGATMIESSVRLARGEIYLLHGPRPAAPSGTPPPGDASRRLAMAFSSHIGQASSANEMLWVGSETNLRLRGRSRQLESLIPGPFDIDVPRRLREPTVLSNVQDTGGVAAGSESDTEPHPPIDRDFALLGFTPLPPPPPAVAGLTLLGILGPQSRRVAVLKDREKVLVAIERDVIRGRLVVGEIRQSSILLGFADSPDTEPIRLEM